MFSIRLIAILTALGAVPGILAIPPPSETTTAAVNAQESGIQTQFLPSVPTGTVAPAPAPSETLRMIHPWGRPDICLTVLGGELIEGAEVGIDYCSAAQDNKRKWQTWNVNRRTEGVLRTSDGKLCLAGGAERTDATRPRLYKCPANDDGTLEKGFKFAPAQFQLQVLPKDNKSGKYCLDVRHDSPAYNGKNWTSLKDVQLWTCSADVKDNNMSWMIMDEGGLYSGSTRPDDWEGENGDDNGSGKKRRYSGAY